MKTIELTDTEIRALDEVLWTNPCESGCAFQEMQNKKNMNCEECKLTKALNSIADKLGLNE